MPKIISIVLIVAGSVILVTGLFFFISKKTLKAGIPKPVSDVKIVYKIGWWAYQDALRVEKLETKIIYGKLNLFNSRSLVEYAISGKLQYRKGWKPYISSVCISERWMPSLKGPSGYRGEVRLIPIVGIKKEKNYNEEKVDFSVKVQDYLHSGGWGKNTYYITSQKEKKIIEVEQLK
jgi:hypothetical protein